MKIQYKNVCSIRKAEVQFNKGELICIKGESNQGKSAIFYSLVDGLTNNKMFKSWINNDALKENPKATAWIGLFDDEGNVYQVEAGTNHMYYRHNDTKYEKVGRKSIFEIIEKQIPGLLYDPEEPNQILNIVGEDSGMFPIDRSDPQIFKTYERLLSLSCTQDITRTIKLDLEDIDYKCSDMLKSIQKNNEQLSKIDSALSNVNVDKLKEIKQTLSTYINNYNRLYNLYNSILSNNNYVKQVNSIISTSEKDFDVNKANSLFNALAIAQNLNKYCNLATYDIVKSKDFNVDKAAKLMQNYSNALTLKDNINILNEEIEKDSIKLNEINSILDSIKTCPFCGKPMEDK